MSRTWKWATAAIVVTLIVATLGYVNREAILLKGIKIAMERAIPVGPHREVTWSTGADPMGRVPDERPPNIVLILADDLGWNDLAFNGGGVAGVVCPLPTSIRSPWKA